MKPKKSAHEIEVILRELSGHLHKLGLSGGTSEQAALGSVHGVGKIEAGLSDFYLVEEIYNTKKKRS